MSKDYSLVTEVSGTKVTREQIARMCTRYLFATDICAGLTVVEAACGSGQGLGIIASKASRVIGLDLEYNLLSPAAKHYQGRRGIALLNADAQHMPVANGAVDAVILYEAIYYLPSPERFLEETLRVLKPGGRVIVCSANRELPDFNPSPYSLRYFSLSELAELLRSSGFAELECFADCPAGDGSVKERTVSVLKRLAVRYGLIPRTMKGKELLKRFFFGRLVLLPGELPPEMPGYQPPVPVACGRPELSHKVVFITGRKPDGH